MRELRCRVCLSDEHEDASLGHILAWHGAAKAAIFGMLSGKRCAQCASRTHPVWEREAGSAEYLLLRFACNREPTNKDHGHIVRPPVRRPIR